MTGSLHLPSGPDLKNKNKKQNQKQKQVLERQLHSEASSSNSLETSLWGLTEVREDLGAYSGISPDDGYQVITAWTVSRTASVVTTAFNSVLRISGFQGTVKQSRVI